MSASGISAFLSSEEAIADWNILTNFGAKKPETERLQKWYERWVDKWHGVQKDVVVSYLIKDYEERQKKLEELGKEKYAEYIQEVTELRKLEALENMKKDIEKGKRDKQQEKIISGQVNIE